VESGSALVQEFAVRAAKSSDKVRQLGAIKHRLYHSYGYAISLRTSGTGLVRCMPAISVSFMTVASATIQRGW
jgi:hypothetical protein